MCPEVLDDTRGFPTDQQVSMWRRPQLNENGAVSWRNSRWGGWAWVVVHRRLWYSCRSMRNGDCCCPHKDHRCDRGSHTQGSWH